MSRFWLIPCALLIFVVAPFLIWGDALTGLMSPEGDKGYMWAIGIGLLVADIFIPIPTTAIIAALGILYGPVIGAGVSIVGSALAAVVGYGIGRWLGRPIAYRFVGDAMAGGERVFAQYGGWIVAASRWLPVLPEVVSMVAGISKMRFVPFCFAVLCGVVPFSVVFAVLGHLGAEQPAWTLILSAVAPLFLWWLANRLGLIRRYGLDVRG